MRALGGVSRWLLVGVLLLGVVLLSLRVLSDWRDGLGLEPGEALLDLTGRAPRGVTLRRGAESLRFDRDASGGWRASGSDIRADESMGSLLEYLGALRVEFPYGLTAGDTVPDYLRDGGLHVWLWLGEGDSLSCSLGMWQDGRVIARVSDRYYIAHAAGYFSGIARTLDLSASSWGARRLWLGEASSLREVRVEWMDSPDQGFTLRRDGGGGFSLFELDGEEALAPDSLRVGALLYSLRDLPYARLSDSLMGEFRGGGGAFHRAVGLTVRADSGEYACALYWIPRGDGYESGRAILELADSSAHLVYLSRWDAALLRLEDVWAR